MQGGAHAGGRHQRSSCCFLETLPEAGSLLEGSGQAEGSGEGAFRFSMRKGRGEKRAEQSEKSSLGDIALLTTGDDTIFQHF